jgi:Protein of unknown function (DUF3618)
MSAAETPGTAGRHRSDPEASETVPSEDLMPVGSEQLEDPAAGAGRPEDAPPAEEALTQEIQATREDLGETVEALAAKVDVKARARDKARAVSGKARARAGGAAQSARSAAASKAAQVRNRASAAGSTVKQAVPEPAQRAVSGTARAAREKRALLAAGGVAVAVLAAGWLIARRRQRP